MRWVVWGGVRGADCRAAVGTRYVGFRVIPESPECSDRFPRVCVSPDKRQEKVCTEPFPRACAAWAVPTHTRPLSLPCVLSGSARALTAGGRGPCAVSPAFPCVTRFSAQVPVCGIHGQRGPVSVYVVFVPLLCS